MTIMLHMLHVTDHYHNRLYLSIMLVVLCLFISSCGNKGALTLPAEQQQITDQSNNN